MSAANSSSLSGADNFFMGMCLHIYTEYYFKSIHNHSAWAYQQEKKDIAKVAK